MPVNTFLTLTVPAANGEGPVLDVSDLSAPKTVFLSGAFEGSYTVLGSHDDVTFVPVLSFSGGEGPQTMRRDVVMTLKSMRLLRQATKTVNAAVAGQLTCPCAEVR